MSEHGHPPLDPDERNLLSYLAVATVAAQAGTDEQTAADALDHAAAQGAAAVRWDQTWALLEIYGHVLVAAERQWLRHLARQATRAMN